MTLICALAGDLWRVMNPFDTLAALVEGARAAVPALRRRTGGDAGLRWPP